MFDDIHAEEARHTDHGKSVHEVVGVAPPCQHCGKRERVGKYFCEDCYDEEKTNKRDPVLDGE
jgi:hypothetical protein